MKKKVIIVIAVIILILGGVLFGLWKVGVIGKKDQADQKLTFENKGRTYQVVLDGHIPFTDSTSVSSVNNEDGLELNYRNTYITMQRFPVNDASGDWKVSDFEKYVDPQGYSGMNQTESNLTTSNPDVREMKVYDLSRTEQGITFYGVLYYFRTEDAFFKVLLSGSDQSHIDRYETFIDDMVFLK